MKFKIWAKSPYIRIFFLLQVIIISLRFNQHIYNRLMSICQSIPASFIRKQRYQITFRTFEVCPEFKICSLGPRGDPHMRPRGHSRYWSIKWYGGRAASTVPPVVCSCLGDTNTCGIRNAQGNPRRDLEATRTDLKATRT